MSLPFPIPGSAPAVVVAEAPGPGRGVWAGGPAAVHDETLGIVLAYRTMEGFGVGSANVIAASRDGERYAIVQVLPQEHFGVMAVERPAIARTPGGWRLWVSCATPGTKHWWIGLLESPTLEGLTDAELRPAFPGDERTAVKDPVIRRTGDGWEAWICCHLLDIPGEEDRMETRHAVSTDGLTWEWTGTVLGPRPGMWDARGARVTTVLPDGRAAYDGRASAEENWFERTGLLTPSFERDGDEPVADVRYLEALPLPGGGHRLFYEARLPDESHELRTELVA